MTSCTSKILLVLSLFLLTVTLSAQETVEVKRSDNKVILEGKVYYIHMVQPGQTLYSIARAYGISEKEISVENPGAMSGLQIGQALKIPVESSVKVEQEETAGEKPSTHKVRRGETMYSIARSYGLSEDQLRDANPGVEPESLKPGMRLHIPQVGAEPEVQEETVYNEEGFVFYKVKRKDTLYSVAREFGVTVEDIRDANPELGWGGPKAGQVIRIPLPQVPETPQTIEDSLAGDSLAEIISAQEAYYYEELLESHDNRRRVYHIAYFIPFTFEEPEPLDSLIKDVKSTTRRNRIIERYHMEEREPQSVPFLEFFQGSLMALDSLRQLGMRLDVSFHDTRRSMDCTRALLEKPGMDDMDLIVGPFHSFNLELVSDFAKQHKIPLVTPFYNELTYVWDNPYLFQTSPSLEECYRAMAKLVASKHEYNIVYVRENDTLDLEKHELFQEMIQDGFEAYRPVEPVIFKEMVLTLNHTDEIIQSLSSDKPNLVIVPTRNEALASRVVSILYYRLKDFDIELLATPFWTEFKSIDYRYYHGLRMIFCSPFWLDYLDEDTDAFLRRYRELYYAEPRAMSRQGINYGVAGFDLTMYFVNALKVYGPRFILDLDEYRPMQVLDSYEFNRISHAGGYLNAKESFHQFLPDMQIVDLVVPDLPEAPAPEFQWQRFEQPGNYYQIEDMPKE